MKFTCVREELDRQLQYVSRVVTVRGAVPILSNILLETDGEQLRISGTDLELAIATVVPAQIEQEGSFTVPAKLFQEFVHQNPDKEVTFHLQSHQLVATSAQVTARIPGIDADEYPAMPAVTEKQQVTLSLPELLVALRQVVIACAQDAGRPVLTGVYCVLSSERVLLVATDSFRLVERSLPGVPVSGKIELLIPMRTVQELIRIATQLEQEAELTLTVGEQQAVLRVGSVELYSRLLSGVFPKYQAIIPSTFSAEGEVVVSELIQALRLALVFSQASVTNVLLEVDNEGVLTISTHGVTRGGGKSRVPITLHPDYKPIQAAFNVRFLLDAVGATGVDTVTLKFSGVTTPLVVSTGDDSYLQLVMPIRMD